MHIGAEKRRENKGRNGRGMSNEIPRLSWLNVTTARLPAKQLVALTKARNPETQPSQHGAAGIVRLTVFKNKVYVRVRTVFIIVH